MTHIESVWLCGVVAATNRGTSAYDTALYNAATMYVAQQNKTAVNTWVHRSSIISDNKKMSDFKKLQNFLCLIVDLSNNMFVACRGWKNYNKSGVGAGQARRPKPPPKAQQLHYCDVCRISCAGPQVSFPQQAWCWFIAFHSEEHFISLSPWLRYLVAPEVLGSNPDGTMFF